jgi:histidinol-phosphate aminotransferase
MGNGGDEAIVAAGRITLEKGAEMVASMPSFPSYYKSALVNGATLKISGIRDNGANDVGEMLSLITDKTKLVFAATPNNPKGGVLSEKEVKKLVEMVRNTALLILDEAYYEFSAGKKGFDYLSVMKKRRGPWAIFRTFSKTYGLAGLRVGYILSDRRKFMLHFRWPVVLST